MLTSFMCRIPVLWVLCANSSNLLKVADKFTHFGQLKGSLNGYMVYGDPIYSLTANSDGIMVRFSNKESIEIFHEGLSEHLSWEDASGEWVHVKITTVFGQSMEVRHTSISRSVTVGGKHQAGCRRNEFRKKRHRKLRG